ncbi:hypothetical protein [Thalassolituus sp.]|jgi:Tfp pilus assembly protein PilF|uniref:hypothetical protein n=1 Tax=Thalassolituus sp. TaxID=2030822 RepID=UPI002A81945E|nr:hypothetical protein [Thalassolituus sp.]
MNRGYQSCTVDDLAESIKKAGGECVFLIGAGCSKSSGIPLANELINEIKERHREVYDGSVSKSYNDLMGKLNVEDRDRLIINHIDKARINWAYLALAKLFLKNHISRILTVNFDPLILRACSMVGCFPAVYDLAVSKTFNEKRIVAKSVFYLNGQHTGFVMLNGADELNEHKKTLEEIVRNTGSKIIWVVIGYSGEADPLSEVLDEMAKTSGFDRGLYWVDYSNKPSASQEKFLKNKSTYFLGGQSADDFMTKLAQKLDCFPPSILLNPFNHMENLLTENIDFSTGGLYAEFLLRGWKAMLDEAKKSTLEMLSEISFKTLILKGEYQQVIDDWIDNGSCFSIEKRIDVAWAYLLKGNYILESSKSIKIDNSSDRSRLFSESKMAYLQALKVNPNMYEAFYNLANLLGDEAQSTFQYDREKSINFWSESKENFRCAIKFGPDDYEIYHNFGVVLTQQVVCLISIGLHEGIEQLLSEAEANFSNASQRIRSDEISTLALYENSRDLGYLYYVKAGFIGASDLQECRHLFGQARNEYQRALSVKVNDAEVVYLYAKSLGGEADQLLPNNPKAALFLWMAAEEKLQLAIKIESDNYEMHLYLGYLLGCIAKSLILENLERSRRNWRAAENAYYQAFQINPDRLEALYNWGNLLSEEAQFLIDINPVDAYRLFLEAEEKYRRALQIEPGNSDVLYDYGYSLSIKAMFVNSENPDEADRLTATASAYFSSCSEKIGPVIAINLAKFWSMKKDVSKCVFWLNCALKHNGLSKAHIDSDEGFDGIRGATEFQVWYEEAFGVV